MLLKQARRLLLAPAGMALDGAAAAAAIAAAVPVNARVDATRVERSFVGSGTSSGYIDQLVRFILYLYDNNDTVGDYLLDQYRTQMDMYNRNDITTYQQRSNRRQKNQRPELRAYIKRCIEAIRPARDGSPHNSPINIDGEGALTYTIVRDYMTSKFNVVEVDKDAAISYLRAIGKGDEVTQGIHTGPRKVRLEVYQSNSQFSAIRSAIAYVYTSSRVSMPDVMANEMTIFINGMQRTISAAKEHLGLKITEGKDALSFDNYEFLVKQLFFSGDKKDVFNRLFLVLDWNLMKRAENCVHAKINHIRFESDSLVFEFAKSKTQQTGDLHGPWHLYANPDKPWICPQLAMAMYLFTFPDVLRGDVPLFEGTNQYARYSACMMKLYKKHEDDLKGSGSEIKNLGSHSTRKGVGTMVASGCTIGPPIVPLCLRAGWALGGVKERYLFRENAGDQYVGRCASGLSPTSKEFAISPAYFDFTGLGEEEALKMKRAIKSHLSSRIPHFSEVSPNALFLAEMCFASICFKYQYLNGNLHEQCPLRNAAVFKDIPDEIVKLGVTRYEWDKTSDTPTFTGIPPHVCQLAKLESLERSIQSIPTQFFHPGVSLPPTTTLK